MAVNPFVGASVAGRYAAARPALHGQAIALLASRVPEVPRAIDIGCGTGLSTHALAGVAGHVVGVDASEDMLAHAIKEQGVSFVSAVAERLPFPDAAFDLASVASAIHWFAPSALREVRRVLDSDGSLLVYDVWFRAEMAGVPSFGEWLEEASATRYPPVQKNPRPDLEEMGFIPAWNEDLRQEVSMSIDGLVDYLMTHSERIAAVQSGLESEEEQRRFFSDGMISFFEEAPRRQLGFGIRVEMFSMA
ncbi:MAG: methyltransferase domain-containing protein [Actinomycetota bacterium]|nr:methyltransferase domain-containing protein [Actinomycetota bacterium]